MYLNKKSPIPVYYQLKSLILKKIEDGEFPAGGLIPSERDLAEKLNISRMTVRQALNQLVAEGILYREKGKGTFVSKIKIEQRNIMSFSETARSKGLVPTTKVLRFEKLKVMEEIRELLTLEFDEMVYAVKRLRLANDIPVGIEEDFIPEKYCPGLEKYDLTSSLYRIINEEYGYGITCIDNVIEAAKPDRQERELLNITAGTPVLKISGVNFAGADLKLFYERSVYRSDEYKYNVRIYCS